MRFLDVRWQRTDRSLGVPTSRHMPRLVTRRITFCPDGAKACPPALVGPRIPSA